MAEAFGDSIPTCEFKKYYRKLRKFVAPIYRIDNNFKIISFYYVIILYKVFIKKFYFAVF